MRRKTAAATSAAALESSCHLPLLRAWVSAEAAAVLAAADERGLLKTLPAALAARAEVVSFRCLAIEASVSTVGNRRRTHVMTPLRHGRNWIVSVLGSIDPIVGSLT